MITVISPSKTLDYESPIQIKEHSQPQLLKHSETLIKSCKNLTVNDIESLMKVSTNLAELNYERFQQWQPKFTIDNALQAILAFKGDVYEGLNVDDFNDDDFQFSQQHLRILSGLYGLLRPLDLMLPYRLEMGTRLKNGDNNNLYQFWGDTITKELNTQFPEDEDTLINLASNEYFKAINLKKLNANVIQPIFWDESKGQYKIISFYAKKARGLMSRYIIKNQINQARDIQSFDLDGYRFDKKSSSDNDWVFKRSKKDAEKAKNKK